MTDKENKSIIKRLRLTPTENEKIQAKCDELGLDFSKFAVSAMLSRPLNKTPITKALILELSKQGNNLNQIAKKLNQGQSLDRIGLSLIGQAVENLNQIYEILADDS